ncbi:MAG: hypothetical protein ACLR23_10490 [Clostridia bacterium]
MSHIAGTYYSSGFSESALLCIDGSGSVCFQMMQKK